LGADWVAKPPRDLNESQYVLNVTKMDCVPTSTPKGPRWPWNHHGGHGSGVVIPLSVVRYLEGMCHQEGLGHVWKSAPNLGLACVTKV
jgi:hypothetical protein